jgi:hypothetical protein
MMNGRRADEEQPRPTLRPLLDVGREVLCRRALLRPLPCKMPADADAVAEGDAAEVERGQRCRMHAWDSLGNGYS